MLPTNLVQYLAQNFSASITSASRPALTFFAVQFSVFISSIFEWLAVEPALDWMVHPGAVAVGGLLAVLEGLAQHDEDVAALMHDFKIHQFIAGLGTFSTALLFTSLGVPAENAVQTVNDTIASGGGVIDPNAIETAKNVVATTQNAVETTKNAAETTQVVVHTYGGNMDPNKIQAGTVISAVGTNFGITYLRGYLHEYFDDLDLLSLWQKIETGGVVGALIVLLFAPILCLIFLMGILAIGAVVGLTIRGAQKVQDEMARYACPHCDHRVRQEAILCPSCHTELQPLKVLASGDKRKGVGQILFPKKAAAT